MSEKYLMGPFKNSDGFYYRVREELCLRNYSKKTIKSYLPKDFLFEGQGERIHISERSVQAVFQRAVKAAEIKKLISVHRLTKTQFCNSFT